jgi:hypothetical protein
MTLSIDELLPLFNTRFPEFSAVSSARITMYLNDALEIYALSATAVVYLAAHLLTLDNDSGAGSIGASLDGGEGEVQVESAGRVSATFITQARTGKESFFTTTAYGRKYLTFRKRFSVRIG